MAQTGDVKFGNSNSPDFNLSLAGTGGLDLPNPKPNSPMLPIQEVFYQQLDLRIQIA